MIYESMVRSTQTVQLSCSDTNTVPEWTEMRFHLSLVTLEHHRVHLKWFPSLWYVRRKPCTYLVSRLAQSPNGPKWGSTWALSPRSSVGCIQKRFLSLWYFWHKPCTNLASRLALSGNKPKRDSTWLKSPSSSIMCVQNDFWACGMFGTNRAPILHRHPHCPRIDWNEVPHDPHRLQVL
jgi:hypothetical protein